MAIRTEVFKAVYHCQSSNGHGHQKHYGRQWECYFPGGADNVDMLLVGVGGGSVEWNLFDFDDDYNFDDP
eukprot:scaffold332_cov113-Skeletonema_menzelii.AAC.1